MATQASAVTFLSMPGQGYQDGLGFVQNYFGAPLALIVIAAVFLPMYRRLNVYTAYEYLGRRFDAKTRLLGAALFLLQRGLQAGITVYAPAIILSTVLHWRTDATILLTGLVVIAYTAAGGSQAVNCDAEIPARRDLLRDGRGFRRPAAPAAAGVGLDGALAMAGGFHKLNGRRLLGRREPKVHVLVGAAGGLLPRAVVLRHRPVAGSALSLGNIAPREPAGADVQRACSRSRCNSSSCCWGRWFSSSTSSSRRRSTSTRSMWERGLERDRDGRLRSLERRYGELHAEKRQRRRGLARRAAYGRPPGRGRARRRGPGRPRPEPGGAGRGEGGARIADARGRSRRTPITCSSRSSSATFPTG